MYIFFSKISSNQLNVLEKMIFSSRLLPAPTQISKQEADDDDLERAFSSVRYYINLCPPQKLFLVTQKNFNIVDTCW